MARLQLYILGHDRDSLVEACSQIAVPYCPVYLPEVEGVPGNLRGNDIAESRFFLSSLADQSQADFVGVFTYRYADKYRARTTQLKDLGKFFLHPDKVYAPDASEASWLANSDRCHPGIAKIIIDAASILKVDVTPRPSAYSNNFILSLANYRRFLKDWRRMFWTIHNQFGLDLPFAGDAGRFSNRRAGLVYERVSMLLLSRHEVVPIP